MTTSHRSPTKTDGTSETNTPATSGTETPPQELSLQDPWKLRILVADDSLMDREWIAKQLQSMDEYDAIIDIACSVAEAKIMISANAYDVVLTDYRLGDGYGDQIVDHCNKTTPSSTTILVSSHSMSEVSLYGVRAAATAAVSKDDLSPSLLETTIRFALANRARLQNTPPRTSV